MFLTSYKLGFALDKASEMILRASSYKFVRQSYNPSEITFECDSRNEVVVYCDIDKQTISKIEVKVNSDRIAVDFNSVLKPKFDLVTQSSFNRIKEIDDVRFLKMFPDYDTQQDRDSKLSDLLGDVEDTKPNLKELLNEPKKSTWWPF